MAPGDLPRRLAVAAVGIPAVLGLLWVGGWVLAVPVAALAAIGADELSRLASNREVAAIRPLASGGAAALVLLAAARPSWSLFAPWALGVLAGLVAASLCVALLRRGPEGRPLAVVSTTVFGTCYAGLALAFVPLLHALPVTGGWPLGAEAGAGLVAVALPLAATWVGDSVAYFAGSKWGRARIAPSISPKKSWVGTWAGLASSAAAGAVWFLVAEPLVDTPLSLLTATLLGAALGAAGQVGDFAESLLKREAGVKDSGRIFPGHGGVLDRLDSLVFAFPMAYALLALAGLAA